MKLRVACAALCCLCGVAAAAADNHREWRFRVLLDGDEIGYHRYMLSDSDTVRRLESEARFDVRFLFFTAYRYRHTNVETWRGGCVQELDARTVTNGRAQVVTGQRRDGHFVVEADGESVSLPACVMTFAYWNPAFLRESRLLNPQTGDYVAVEVQRMPDEPLELGGTRVPARHFRVTAKNVELELWYSRDDRWLALETAARGGRRLRYELVTGQAS